MNQFYKQSDLVEKLDDSQNPEQSQPR